MNATRMQTLYFENNISACYYAFPAGISNIYATTLLWGGGQRHTRGTAAPIRPIGWVWWRGDGGGGATTVLVGIRMQFQYEFNKPIPIVSIYDVFNKVNISTLEKRKTYDPIPNIFY